MQTSKERDPMCLIEPIAEGTYNMPGIMDTDWEDLSMTHWSLIPIISHLKLI